MSTMKKIPWPISGLILALFALGNLLESYSPTLRYWMGGLASLLYLALLMKALSQGQELKKALNNPMIASVLSTFPMATVLLAQYIENLWGKGKILWYAGFLLHSIYLIWFLRKYLFHDFDLKKVLPSWFPVTVGLATISITAPLFQAHFLGQVIFYLALLSYIFLLFLIGYRLYLYPIKEKIAQPTMVIYAAPASLLLAGYQQSYTNKSLPMVYLLLFLSLASYLFGLWHLVKNVKAEFLPSYAAFTFPMVISAIASKMTQAFFQQSGQGFNLLALVKIQELLACLIVVFVLIQYLLAIFQPAKEH